MWHFAKQNKYLQRQKEKNFTEEADGECSLLGLDHQILEGARQGKVQNSSKLSRSHGTGFN